MSYSPENSEDPLFTKKSRRCDDFPVVFGDSFPSLLTLPSSVPLRHLCCDSEDVNLPKNPSSSSYKDKVTDSHDMGTEDLYPLDDDDIDLLEEDVCFGEVDAETHSDSPVPPTDLCVDPPADPYVEDSPNDAPHDPPLSDDLIRDSHSHITHAVDKAPFGARVENARITSKVTVPSRKSIGISLGSSSLSIPTSRMSRPGSSLTNRHPKSKNMGAFLNPKKNSAIRIEVDDNHVTTILKRPTPSSTSHLHRIKSWILFQLLTMSTIGLTWLIDHSTILLSFHDEFKHDSVESPRM
ncbi:hypothetical protein V6N13_113915 [Hibiscus sabdariffa]